MPIPRAAIVRLAVLILTVTGCGSAATPTTSPPVASPAASASTAAAASATASPTPQASASASAFRVVGLVLKADPADHVGSCPIKITFSATVTAKGGAGTVSYRWVSSDGDASPTKTIDVHDSTPETVTSSWTVDPTSLPTHAGWSSIELVGPTATTPDSVESARADFVFTCDTDDDVEAIGFGLGGSDADCSIKTPLRTFAPTDRVRMVANWWPSLADGTTVTIQLTRAGTVVDGYPVTTHLTESTKCLHGSVSSGYLAPGHYQLHVMPDTARAIDGEFDVK